VHVEVDGSSRLRDVHVITDALEDEISRVLPSTEAIIHPEPAGLNDARLDYRIAREAARHPVPERTS
jgi:divalent metal cation (Fe/Co/Zn/Cd) transporter